jgi:class 3 adenylate cyclase
MMAVMGVTAIIIFPNNMVPIHPSEQFSSPVWIPALLCIVVAACAFGAMFVPALYRFRELCIFACMAVHWPTFLITLVFGRDPHDYSYVFECGCFFFCVLLSLPRFMWACLVLTLPSITTLIAATFGSTFFHRFSYLEIVYWPVLVFALAMLYHLETRSRKSFIKTTKARRALQRVHQRIALMHVMVSRYFPATPTLQLLHSAGADVFSVYRNVAMVVTDVAGFTQWTATAEPEAVLSLVNSMFMLMDSEAIVHGMEKVSTVGDSYVAVRFTESPSRHAMCTSAAAAVRFACATINAPASVGLQLRAGVHLGDLVGGFIGAAPPKFDIFGRDVEFCRALEPSCVPGCIHLSTAVEDAITGILLLDDVVSRTAESVCVHHVSNLYNHEADHEELCGLRLPSVPEDLITERPRDVCRAILAMSNRTQPTPEIFTGERQVTTTSLDADVSTVHSGVDTEIEERLRISLLKLEFVSASLERRYQLRYAGSKASHVVLWIMFLLQCWLYLAALLLGCTDSLQNRLVFFIIALLLAAMGAYLIAMPQNVRRGNLVVMNTVYGAITTLAFLALRADCEIPSGPSSSAAYYHGHIAAMWWEFWVLNGQLLRETPFRYRVATMLVVTALFFPLVAIRRAIYHDEVGTYSYVALLLPMAFVMTSYVVDLAERYAFQAIRHLSVTLRSAKGEESAEAERALEVMVPGFVSERLSALDKKQQRDPSGGDRNETSDADDSVSVVSALSESEAGTKSDSDSAASTTWVHGVQLSWRFEFAVVGFIYLPNSMQLMNDDTAASFKSLRGLMLDIEHCLRNAGVTKIKSNGSSILIAAGVDTLTASRDQASALSRRDHSVFAMLDAVGRILRGPLASLQGWRIGLHCGPCFGAVIGRQGIMFDVFGDVINTASRFTTTAAVSTVQMSAPLHRRAKLVEEVLAERGVVVAAQPSYVTMKGKGEVARHEMRAVAGADASRFR